MTFTKKDNYECLVCGKPVVKNGVVMAKAGRIQTEGYWCWDCIIDDLR